MNKVRKPNKARGVRRNAKVFVLCIDPYGENEDIDIFRKGVLVGKISLWKDNYKDFLRSIRSKKVRVEK